MTSKRVIAFVNGGNAGLGIAQESELAPLPRYAAADAAHALEMFYRDWETDAIDWTESRHRLPIGDVKVLAPARPSAKILCQVVNYTAHGKEASIEPPSRPFFFLRPASSVVGAADDIQAHALSSRMDFEVELALMIGAAGRNITPERARDHIGALLVANDVSYRDIQFNSGHEDLSGRFGQNWTHGKGLDGSCVLGPWLTMGPDLLGRPRRLECHVNGELRQNASTDQMIYGPEELISAASQGMTLNCGDIILTGTPAGVGLADHRYLNAGDVVRSSISGLGHTENVVVAVR